MHLHVKVLLYCAIFLATCLTILLRHKWHESLPSVTCPEPCLAFCCCYCNRCEKLKSVLLRATMTATKTLRDVFISGYQCYTTQRSVQHASQRRNEMARQVARKISQCSSAFKQFSSMELLTQQLHAHVWRFAYMNLVELTLVPLRVPLTSHTEPFLEMAGIF